MAAEFQILTGDDRLIQTDTAGTLEDAVLKACAALQDHDRVMVTHARYMGSLDVSHARGIRACGWFRHRLNVR